MLTMHVPFIAKLGLQIQFKRSFQIQFKRKNDNQNSRIIAFK